MFYNGTKQIEDLSEMRLSSAYECLTEEPDLELRVTVLNVNEGHNKELMEHCRMLKDYAQYVGRVRKYISEQNLSLEEAVENAVDECIKEGILADFLKKHRAEVVSVSIFEYNKEDEEKKLRRAEFEAGKLEERRKNIREMLLDNVSIDKIKRYTQATHEEIIKIQEELK